MEGSRDRKGFLVLGQLLGVGFQGVVGDRYQAAERSISNLHSSTPWLQLQFVLAARSFAPF